MLLGVALDAAFGDPRRGHPVALFGRAASWVEQRVYGRSRVRGVVFTGLCVGGATGLGLLARKAGPRTEIVVTALATWTVLGGTSLEGEGLAMARLLEAGDLAGGRRRLSHLCARDPRDLDADALARATVESIAENTSDAVVAPLFWGVVAGVPGLLAYRAINTLDAMVGYRNERYEQFGWASARLDDVVNWIPARLTGLLTVAVAENRRAAYRILKLDGSNHPSPNAGRCEAAAAGALGIRLGGTNVYGGHRERRPELGDGRKPEVRDIRRAVRLSRNVALAAAAGLTLTRVLIRKGRP